MVGLPANGGLTKLIPWVGGPVPGSSAADFQTVLDQVRGNQFLQAYEGLRGGGQITEVEGKKAEEAKARMNTAQSEEAFVQATLEFRDEVQRLLEIARAKAQGATGAVEMQTPIPQQPQTMPVSRNSGSSLPPITREELNGGASLPAPQNEAEYMRLPAGTRYRAPDGTTRTKGGVATGTSDEEVMRGVKQEEDLRVR